MKKPFKTWIYLCIGNTSLLLFIFLVFSFGSLSYLKEITFTQTEANLRTFARALERLFNATAGLDSVEKNKTSFDTFVKQIASDDPGFRISIIDQEGTIVGDSDATIPILENHGTRPEVKAALEGRDSTDIRTSSITGQTLIYYAVPILYGNTPYVLRVSVPAHDTVFFSTSIRISMLLSSAGIILAAILIALLITSRSILRPLKKLEEAVDQYRKGDFSPQQEISGPEEFAVLGKHIGEMADSLRKFIHILAIQNQQTETILSGMNEALFVFDTNMHLHKINRAAELLFDIKAERCLGLPLIRIIRSTEISDFVASIINGTMNEPEIEVQLQAPISRFFLIRCTAIRPEEQDHISAEQREKKENKNNMRYILVCTDITRLKNLERIRKDFVANVSHELKTPITAIQGFIETLQDGALEDTEAAVHFLDIMSRQSKRLTLIIEDLLTISRLEQNENQVLEKADTPVEDLFSAVEQTCSASAHEKQITLKFVSSSELTAHINPGLMEQALTNLVDNAIKYSPNGSKVIIRAERKKRLIISVEDNGPGIPEHAKERVFERFYRIDQGRSREMGGTGLGLSIVRHIILAHGGTIRLAPTKEGSRFIIEL